jgi:hypothetical protein
MLIFMRGRSLMSTSHEARARPARQRTVATPPGRWGTQETPFCQEARRPQAGFRGDARSGDRPRARQPQGQFVAEGIASSS